MYIQIYTDDGYRQYQLVHVAHDIDIDALIRILYEKGILTTSDINGLLPPGYEVVE